MAAPIKPTDRELKFVLALAGGYPITRAAVEAGYSKRYGRELVKRESVRETILSMAANLCAIALKEYRE